MASAQVVETSVNTNNSPSQDYTTNPDDHSNHNIDSPGFKPFTVKLRFIGRPGGYVSLGCANFYGLVFLGLYFRWSSLSF